MDQTALNSKEDTIGKAFHRLLRYLFAPFFPSQWRQLLAKEPATQGTQPRRTRSYKRVAIEAVLYYFLLSPAVAMPLYNTLIFHPAMIGHYEIQDVGGIPKETVFFRGKNNVLLHGWFFKNPLGSKTVLVSHGNAGNLTTRVALIKLLLDAGASVFIYDYEGYGLSSGSPSVDSACSAGNSAYTYLTEQRKIGSGTLVLYGESLGTGITCRIAASHPCRGVILQSGFVSLPALAAQKMPLFRLYPDCTYPVDRLNNLAFVKGEHPRLLIVHGTEDRTIPFENAEILHREASAPKGFVRLAGTDHNDCSTRPSYQLLVALADMLN